MTAEARVSRKEQLIEAAAVLFDRQGYYTTGVEDIARAIGLSKPTLYHYVRTKGEIVAWIHDEIMDILLRRLEERVSSGLSPIEVLRLNVIDIIDVMDTKPGHLRVFFEHHREIPEALRREAKVKRDRYQALIELTIADGIEKGMFRKTDVRLATLALFGITNWSYQWYRPAGPAKSQEVAQHLFDVFLGGISATGPDGSEPVPAVLHGADGSP
ncbi:TetR family transcriptional regulator [Blastococcus colisei]|uniref:TetR family transcriptional regulator n=1 Tax=Blastococcus colisei TaxID=1564162 RepID=A0A543PG49_9ACTN|nr:TetR/AcrR family transcriptional regulator [Blastococcus colisei]TQN43051.1 TetR family transcriptional regulator [Blastococcus colisei]